MDTVSREDVEHLLKSFFDHPERQTFKDREVIKMLVNRAHKASYQGITRQTIPFEIGCTAYRYVLDSGGSAEEALKYSAKIHDKSVEWLEGKCSFFLSPLRDDVDGGLIVVRVRKSWA